MRIDKEEVVSELALSNFGGQGFYQNKDSECPFCHKKDKWGIKFSAVNGGGVFHCFKCGEKASIFTYLTKVGRKDLCRVTYTNTLSAKLVPLMKQEEEETEVEIEKPVTMPKKTVDLHNDPYLDDRGFLSIHYAEFEPCYTAYFLEKRLHDYIIFKIKQKGVLCGWLARSRKSKEWHEKNMQNFKAGLCRLALRYENSNNDFSKMIGGYDRITENTQTVILVEGLFDMVNIDKLLQLDSYDKIRCCCTFGNSICHEQIELLREKKGIEEVILMYDFDTIKEQKSAGLLLMKFFKTTITHIDKVGVDPGSIDIDYLIDIIDKRMSPMNYLTNKIKVK